MCGQRLHDDRMMYGGGGCSPAALGAVETDQHTELPLVSHRKSLTPLLPVYGALYLSLSGAKQTLHLTHFVFLTPP